MALRPHGAGVLRPEGSRTPARPRSPLLARSSSLPAPPGARCSPAAGCPSLRPPWGVHGRRGAARVGGSVWASPCRRAGPALGHRSGALPAWLTQQNQPQDACNWKGLSSPLPLNRDVEKGSSLADPLRQSESLLSRRSRTGGFGGDLGCQICLIS